jgi:cytochrome b involved in lipid metabolism
MPVTAAMQASRIFAEGSHSNAMNLDTDAAGLAKPYQYAEGHSKHGLNAQQEEPARRTCLTNKSSKPTA